MEEETRFAILVCVGGGEDSFLGIKYASTLERGICADIDLLYVRPQDRGLSSGGLEIRVARENVLDWGLELPGARTLRKAREILLELGEISEDTRVDWTHRDVKGDPVGDNYVEYRSSCGRRVGLHLRTSNNLVSTVIEEQERYGYEIVIVGASKYKSGLFKRLRALPLSHRIAAHVPCSVLVARNLEPDHGHLLCTDGSERSLQAIRKAGILSSHCACPITLISVAGEDKKRKWASANVSKSSALLHDMGIRVQKTIIETGDPVEKILEYGKKYSLIMLADSERSWLKRCMSRSVPYEVLTNAENSVMILR